MATYLIVGTGYWMTTVEAPSGLDGSNDDLSKAVDRQMDYNDMWDMEPIDWEWEAVEAYSPEDLDSRVCNLRNQGYEDLYPTPGPPAYTDPYRTRVDQHLADTTAQEGE